jgi:hypothetical protein
MICSFVCCLQPLEQFFSYPVRQLSVMRLCPPEHFFIYLAVVTITGDRDANLDLCLAFMAFSSEGLFHATTTAIHDFSLLWNHHCSCGTNVRGFFGPPLPKNLHSHEHVFIPSLIFINSISKALFISYPQFTSP